LLFHSLELRGSYHRSHEYPFIYYSIRASIAEYYAHR
jgi:hypothetical protein